MDGRRLLSRRTMLAAAAAGTIPATGVGWYLLSSGAAQNSSAADETGPQPVGATGTWNPTIRVNLTPENIDELTMSVDNTFNVVVPGHPRVLAYNVKPVREMFVSADSNSTGIRLGNTVMTASQIEIVPAIPVSIWVGRSQYRGSIRLYRKPSGKLMAVNVLPLEDYLASVVNSEMPASFPMAAREAQAIVARTYALTQMKGHPLFDLYSTTRSQMYLGYQYRDSDGRRLAGETSGSRKIIRDTAGIVCTYKGKIFTTYYSAVCGGRTTNGQTVYTNAVPALKSVECDWCKSAKRYRWKTEVPLTEASQSLQQHVSAKGGTFGTLASIQLNSGTPGDLPEYTVSDGRSRRSMAGTTLQRALPQGAAHSPHFTASIAGNTLTLSGRGHGHGVGLCQWGAKGLGDAGRSALEILAYYYSGIETVRLQPPGSTD